MSDSKQNGLYLPTLSIRNFRGIRDLAIRRLGRVTLIAGRNGAGKTTVLEAVRVYAARGRASVLNEILDRREELSAVLDEDHAPVTSWDYSALFFGRTTPQGPIAIGPNSGRDQLQMKQSGPDDWSDEQRDMLSELLEEADGQALKVVYGEKETVLPMQWAEGGFSTSPARRRSLWRLRRSRRADPQWPVVECQSLGPGLLSNDRLAEFWDTVALTAQEDIALDALRLTGDPVERVAVIGEKAMGRSGGGRRVAVKLRGNSLPVPLKSLGDGSTRLFAAGLALASSRNGFLTIDEAENGIHYSVQRTFWRMVLEVAHRHNVQVLATTHSKDCIRGFARAASELEDVAGALVRVERDPDGDGVRAVEYSEDALKALAEEDIETR